VILEQFISASDGRLRMSMLEECYPYTILRVNNIELYESQTQAYVRDQDEEKDERRDVPRPPVSRRISL
jgi:hypothetical protein